MPIALQRLQIELLNILRRGLQDHLQLHVLEQPVGILAVASVRRTPRRLHVRDLVRLRSQHAQERFRSHGAGADLNVVGLLQHASALGPKSLQAQDEFLERERIGRGRFHERLPTPAF